MRQILLGTSNPSKAAYFAGQLKDYDVSFLLLRDFGIEKQPDEEGKSPLENALIKAAYYGRFHDYVISEDSALYIRELPLDDPRQPGLTIRRSPSGGSMDDDGMLRHYSALAHELGGRMTCYYVDAYAGCNLGQVSGFCEDGHRYTFYMVDKPHPARTPGWPLDSISVWPETGHYFVENRERHLSDVEQALERSYRDKLMMFYKKKLELIRL